jgi:hypothetical protein
MMIMRFGLFTLHQASQAQVAGGLKWGGNRYVAGIKGVQPAWLRPTCSSSWWSWWGAGWQNLQSIMLILIKHNI